MIHWKNFTLFAIVTLISIGYKPFFENKNGTTIGKNLLKIKVESINLKKTTLIQILLRNIFNIIPGIVSIYLMISIFNQPEFASLTTYKKYAKIISHSGSLSIFNNICMLIYFIDVLFIWMDDKNRSLHDRIGNTLVTVNVENKSNQ